MKTLLFTTCILISFILNANKITYPKDFAPQKQNHAITFTENKGQVSDQDNKARPDVLYSGNTNGMVYHLRNNGISYQLNRVDSWKDEKDPRTKEKIKVPALSTFYRLDVNWINCNANLQIINDEALPGYNNYYTSSCPNGVDHVKTYTGITYKNIYNNINLHYYEKNGTLKYDYIVAARADYKQIKLEIKGAEKISLNKKGVLVYKTPLGNITEQAPLVIQKGKTLVSKWILKNNILSFEIQDLDAAQEFIIDPAVRVWGTYYGGGNDDRGFACTTDGRANVFLAGNTISLNNMATTGSYQSTFPGTYACAFIVKFNVSGVRQWGTYYGGIAGPTVGGTQGLSCAADATGNIYMAGCAATPSGNEIATAGSHQPVNGGLWDAYLAKFDTAGVRLWATYYGGTGNDLGYGCATDSSSNVYLMGDTQSPNAIGTAGSHQPSLQGPYQNVFLVKFNSAGVRQWGTYYCGVGGGAASGCATNINGDVCICGQTSAPSSTDIASPGAHQTFFAGGQLDAFVATFNSSGIRKWGTYYGGSGTENGYGCCMDNNGNVFLTGNTDSNAAGTAIASAGSHQTAYGGGTNDAFLVKFDSTGTRQWGTYYGGTAYDQAFSCTTDLSGHLYLGGETASGSGTVIATPGSHQPLYGSGQQSAFLIKFTSNGVRQWGTYYGFLAYGNGRGCAVNNAGNIYLAGFAGGPTSTTIVATANAHQSVFGGGVYDAFLVNFYECPAPDVTAVSNSSIICAGANVLLTASGATSYTWNTGSNSQTISVTPVSSISYTVVGSDGSACVDTAVITLIVDVCTKLNQQSTDAVSVSVYPNPHNGEFIIESKSPMEMVIHNQLGEIIMTKQLSAGKNSIDLKNYANGIYMIQLSDEENNKTIKLIKE